MIPPPMPRLAIAIVFLGAAAARRYAVDGVQFVETDLHRPGLRRESFDVVYSSGVLLYQLLTGERPFIFAWEPTHELNAVMARDHATLSKDEAASAIEEGLARLRAIASRMNEDAWSREVFEYENRRRSADVVLRRIVLPHAAEHLASMRRTLSPETGAR